MQDYMNIHDIINIHEDKKKPKTKINFGFKYIQ